MDNLIKTTCPYCGVGCGVQATVNQENRTLTIQGDKSHPANFGKLCSKGSALADTVTLAGRLLQPHIAGQVCSMETALDKVANTFLDIIRSHGPDAVAIYGSGQLLTEDYYVANKLMKGFIGNANIDTNSRLCMSSSVAGHKRAFGADTVPGCYEDFEHAELIVLIGSNAAWCHPVSFQRIKAAKMVNPQLKIVVIDPRHTQSCDIADLHLPIAPGADAMLFNGLLHYLQQESAIDQDYIAAHTEGFSTALTAASHTAGDIQQLASYCRLSVADINQFFVWFATHERVMSLYSQGINQSATGTDKVNGIINCHLVTGRIGKPGMGPFSLTGQPNAMGGREVGGLSHQLAAHMDFSQPADVDRVARFWRSPGIARQPGLPAVALFDAIHAGKIKAVWIMGTNPVVSLPNADKVKQALQACQFVVVSDCIAQTDTTAYAHVLLPAAGWSEKEGTVTNSERRISRQRALFAPAGNAKPDWWLITQVARRMGFAAAFPYQTAADIFREHAALSGFENDAQHGWRDFDISAFAAISTSEYQQLTPTQWPVNQRYPQGKARLFADGKFFTPSGKAQIIPIIPQAPLDVPDQHYPLTLNTGRVRDQWHTMTRTTLAVKLNQHKPEPFVEVHPDDAKVYGLQAHALARITSKWGSMLARVEITDQQLPGSLFVPMHWTAQWASQGRMGALVNPAVDPISKQPESKQTAVTIQAYQPLWYGFILSRRELIMSDIDYWVKVKGEGYYRYELAGEQSLTMPWSEWLASKLAVSLAANDVNTSASAGWQEYQDAGLGSYRAAQLLDNRLESIIFIGTNYQLPARSWLSELFLKTELDLPERRALLTGLPPLGIPDAGPIVCACFNVGANTLKTSISDQHLTTVQEVGRCLKAGSNCGSCVPEIKAILAGAVLNPA